MSTYLGTYKGRYGTVKRYRADTTPEQEQEVITNVLKLCARAKKRMIEESKKKQEEDKKPENDNDAK